MTRKSTTIQGYIRAIADQYHPLQTKLSLILTDFEPNGNKQGIPREEKDNIIRTAQYMPLKINFNGESFAGHNGAFPVGPIINAYESKDNGRDVIMGDAVIWNEVYKDVAEHLKTAFSEGVGTSWEIYFEDSIQDTNGIEWLQGCVFAGQCVVEIPAYGPNRTRILAIAEKLAERETEFIEMAETNMEETRNELLAVQDVLFKLWEGVDTLFNKTFEIEQAQVENDIGKIAEQFAEKLSKIANRINELSDATAEKERLSSELETVQAELNVLKQEKAESEANKARAELIQTRLAKLSDVGIIIETTDTDRVGRYVDMSDTLFEAYVADLRSVKGTNSANSELRVLPEPLGSGNDNLTTQELVEALKQRNRRG